MELAKTIRESKIPPKKSILFIAFNGEESGLHGSWNYCQGPVYPLNKAVMINLDMIGSTAKIPLTIAVASKKSNTSLSDTLAEYADKLSIEYIKMVENGSDHTPFDNHGVPSVCLANLDLSHGYHSPKDTIETVDSDRLEEIVKLVHYYIEKNAY
jgi:Zn-dependent M28 family amino/carboxypeptidase